VLLVRGMAVRAGPARRALEPAVFSCWCPNACPGQKVSELSLVEAAASVTKRAHQLQIHRTTLHLPMPIIVTHFPADRATDAAPAARPLTAPGIMPVESEVRHIVLGKKSDTVGYDRKYPRCG
jgi:hypothetical protein